MKHLGNPVIGIIGGKGKMGRLFAGFFKHNGFKVLISDTDTSLTNEDLASQSDVIIVSVPIDKTREVIKKVVHLVGEGKLFMDLTSVKEQPIKEMLRSKAEVIGLHPMFADTNSIKGQTVLICPARAKKWLNWIKKLFKRSNVNVKVLTPKQHDEMMAVAQSLIHFADIVFADALKTLNKPIRELLGHTSMASDLKVALSARLLNQDPHLYGTIQMENPYSLKAIKKYAESVISFIKLHEKGDLAGFKRKFNRAQKFLSDYSQIAHNETDWVIEQLLKKRGRIYNKPANLPTKGDIGVMGPQYTYSDIVAHEHFPSSKRAYFEDVVEVFQAVRDGNVKMGVVPIENMLEGTIRETLDELFKRNVKIIQEIKFPIHHCLASLHESNMKSIKRIYSHPQAIKQCSRFLKNRFNKAEIGFRPSTASAIEKLLQENDKDMGVICSVRAAQANNLKILKQDVEDSHENETIFIVISKKEAPRGEKTLIAFHFSKDNPGSLFGIFKDFKDARINMTKIESRPVGKELGEYIFFLDFEGDRNNANVKKVLADIEKKTAKLKVFGSF